MHMYIYIYINKFPREIISQPNPQKQYEHYMGHTVKSMLQDTAGEARAHLYTKSLLLMCTIIIIICSYRSAYPMQCWVDQHMKVDY